MTTLRGIGRDELDKLGPPEPKPAVYSGPIGPDGKPEALAPPPGDAKPAATPTEDRPTTSEPGVKVSGAAAKTSPGTAPAANAAGRSMDKTLPATTVVGSAATLPATETARVATPPSGAPLAARDDGPVIRGPAPTVQGHATLRDTGQGPAVPFSKRQLRGTVLGHDLHLPEELKNAPAGGLPSLDAPPPVKMTSSYANPAGSYDTATSGSVTAQPTPTALPRSDTPVEPAPAAADQDFDADLSPAGPSLLARVGAAVAAAAVVVVAGAAWLYFQEPQNPTLRPVPSATPPETSTIPSSDIAPVVPPAPMPAAPAAPASATEKVERPSPPSREAAPAEKPASASPTRATDDDAAAETAQRERAARARARAERAARDESTTRGPERSEVKESGAAVSPAKSSSAKAAKGGRKSRADEDPDGTLPLSFD